MNNLVKLTGVITLTQGNAQIPHEKKAFHVAQIKSLWGSVYGDSREVFWLTWRVSCGLCRLWVHQSTQHLTMAS